MGWTLFIANVVHTLMFLSLVFGYPGYPTTAYSWGIPGYDTDMGRNDAFDLQLSLGVAFGIPQMTLVDHLNIVIAHCAILGWLGSCSKKLQTFVGGMALLNGCYMLVFPVVFISARGLSGFSANENPLVGAIVGSILFACGLARLRENSHARLLKYFMWYALTIMTLLTIMAFIRAPHLSNLYNLRRECASEVPGTATHWPRGWDWEPMPFGGSGGWPVGEWPVDIGNACHPSPEVIHAAQKEYRTLYFVPLWVPFLVLVGGIVVFAAAIAISAAPKAKLSAVDTEAELQERQELSKQKVA